MDFETQTTAQKIEKAKAKLSTVKAIEKLEKEVLRLEKSITAKKAKIIDLAKEL